MSRAAGWIALGAVLLGLTGGAVALERTGVLEPPTEPRPAPGPTAESLDEQFERVAAAVARLRRLEFEEVPEPTYLAPDELALRASEFVEEYAAEDAETDRRILAALGAVPADADLREMLSRVLAEQVAGFYDPDTGDMVVGRRVGGEGSRLGAFDELTLAHELEHALADQVFGLPGEDDEDVTGQEDASFAATALVEGDATLTMSLYAAEELSLVDRMELLQEQPGQVASMEQLAAMPHVIRRSLLFPYEEGLEFVSALYRDTGGWSTVDAAYERPPVSTLQILDPAMYLRGEGGGADPPDLATPPGNWERGETLGLGAADLLFLFEAPGDDESASLDSPRVSSMAWRGGNITLWTDDSATTVGASMLGTPGLCEDVIAWYARAFPASIQSSDPSGGARRGATFDGGEQDAAVACGDSGVDASLESIRVGIAPDLDTASALVAD